MRMKFWLSLWAGLGLVILAGCVSTVDGRRELGMPFSKDTFVGKYDRSPQDLWLATQDVLKYLGTITSKDTARNVIQANVDTRTVWVKIEQIDSKYSRDIVQARTKGGLGDQALAAFIDKEIAVRLATGNLTPASPTSTVSP